MPQFNALSGRELKKVILAGIEKALDESGDFNNHITYPWVKYDFQVRLTSYPKDSVDAEPQPVATGEGIQGEPENLPAGDPEVKVISSDGPVIIDTPDQARVGADLPLPTPTPVVGIGIVDRLVKQTPAKKGK